MDGGEGGRRKGGGWPPSRVQGLRSQGGKIAEMTVNIHPDPNPFPLVVFTGHILRVPIRLFLPEYELPGAHCR